MMIYPGLERVKVLVVDDQAVVRAIIVRLLAQLGVRCLATAETVAEALRMIGTTREPFDVLVCDLSMPAEDGLVCLRKLAGFDTKPAVVLMSGKDALVLESAQCLGERLGLRILGTLAKPVTSDALARVLARLMPVEAVSATVLEERLTESEIRWALEDGRFEPWFQPQYHLASGRVLGVEALLRLRDPERGIMGPASFIGPAEEYGLIGRLTDFVLDHAAASCAKWQASGWPLTVSVNLSPAGLDDLTLPDRAAAICRSHGVAPDRVVIEMTESSLARDATAALDIMTRLRLKGFRLSLDDFGTGYASLEELRSLPFHELKLDKRFVQDAAHNPRSRAILESSIQLAVDLKMSTVAEGIETDAMLQAVVGLGCDVAQGYLLGRPMPADQLPGWFVRRPLEATVIPRAASAIGMAARNDAAASERITAGESETVLRFSHDVASPLMVVLALSEVLMSERDLRQAHRDDISQIHEAAKEVAALVKGLAKSPEGSDETRSASQLHPASVRR